MPADMSKLITCLTDMKKTYLADPIAAVRGQTFIYQLHKYCVEELYAAIGSDKVQKIELTDMKLPTGKPHYPSVAIDPKKYQLMQEVTLFGSHKNKDEDIALTHFSTDPPTLIPSVPELSIETFFDKLVATHNDRNLFNQL